MTDRRVVGTSVARPDALEKVTGAARYTSDVGLHLPNLLHGRILHSPYAHANILSVDTSRAERLPGVKAVLCGKDVPPVRLGLCVADRHLLCRDKARFVGDAVAAVAATSAEAAEEALELIKVEYEELPAVYDPEEAMRPDCAVVIHPELPTYFRPFLPYLGRDLPGPNVAAHHKIRRGDVEEGFRRSDLIVENRYTTARVAHCQLEPYNAYAWVEGDGTLNVWSSSHQTFSAARGTICAVFGLPPSKVRIRSRYIGGNFGAQPLAEPFAALLALKTGKPVRVNFTREECFTFGLNQQPVVMYIKDGVTNDGVLLARDMRVISNSGPTAAYAPLVSRNSSFALSHYRIPNVKWDSYSVYTNESCVGPLRGFGVPQIHWAIEQQMDVIAERLGMDAVELRRKNLLREGEENVRGELVEGSAARECLDQVAAWIGSNEPAGVEGQRRRIGRGLALGNKYSLDGTFSAARIKVLADGTIEVHHGGDEVGQGVNTVLAQIVAEEFNTTVDQVRIFWGDTASVPYDFGAVSSRTTFNLGNAARLACEDAKRQIFELASKRLECAPQDLEIRAGKLYVKGSPERSIMLGALFPYPAGGCLSDAGEILGKASFVKPGSIEDPETGQGRVLAAFYSYGAQAAEVAVDTETGQVEVLRFAAAFDMGQPINPKMCEAQIEGGVVMGIGSALYEEMQLDNGVVRNPNFTDYRVPHAGQLPRSDDFKSILAWAPQKDGPYEAKGLGEAILTPTAPAIASAIYDAVGVRIRDLPIIPEKVLKALREKETGVDQGG